jgi:hypothetical protein
MTCKVGLIFATVCSLQASLHARAGSRGGIAPVMSDSAGLLRVLRANNEPVQIVEMKYQEPFSLPAPKKGRLQRLKVPNLNVWVLNRSDRAVSYIQYSLDPPDRCPGWSHPLSIWVWYGRTQPTAAAPVNPAEPAIAPGQSVQIVVKGADLEWIHAESMKAKCGPNDRTDFTIWKVAFTDGTGWEAFADGPSNSEWNGRPWTPPEPGSAEAPAKGGKR